MVDLTTSEAFVLRWLSQAETSQLGECKGSDLDTLFNQGLAHIVSSGPVSDFSLVSVTDAGLEVLKQTQ